MLSGLQIKIKVKLICNKITTVLFCCCFVVNLFSFCCGFDLTKQQQKHNTQFKLNTTKQNCCYFFANQFYFDFNLEP